MFNSEEPRKTCPSCKRILARSEFYINPKGHASYCKECKQAKRKAWFDTPAGKAMRARRDHTEEHLKARYGMTVSEYNQLLERANGVCEICCKPTNKKLYVDHCHGSNKIRGLLCRSCNLVLGFANDNPDVLVKAVEYLSKTGEQ